MAQVSATAGEVLRKRLENKTATIAVVGLGYVGLPLVRSVHDSGFRVIGYDADDAKIDQLLRGESYIRHVGDELAAELAASI